MQHPTTEELLSDPEEVRELSHHLDRCMLYMVLYLKHAPEQLEDVVACYDNISLFREALQNYKTKS